MNLVTHWKYWEIKNLTSKVQCGRIAPGNFCPSALGTNRGGDHWQEDEGWGKPARTFLSSSCIETYPISTPI